VDTTQRDGDHACAVLARKDRRAPLERARDSVVLRVVVRRPQVSALVLAGAFTATTSCGRVNYRESLPDAGAFDANADAGSFDAGAFDAGSFDAGSFDANTDALRSCADDACGPPVVYDVAAGFTANLPMGVGDGSPAAQSGRDGWWYRYHPRMSFGSYGALPADAMDPAALPLMEHGRLSSDRVGWYATSGVQIGQRGALWTARWADGLMHLDGDALTILPENSVQVVLEWRAPSAGLAELDMEVAQLVSGDGDVEVHVFVRIGARSEELSMGYFSYAPNPDANGQVPAVATLAAPVRLVATRELAAGDGLFVYVRVGDNDSSDQLALRGGVRFWPR